MFPDSVALSAASHLAAAAQAARAKDGEQLTQLLLSALELEPTNTQALCGLARLAQVNKSPHEALQLLRQSLTLDPTNLQAMHLWLEIVAANSPQDLLTTCQSLANLAPTDLEVLTLLAQLHAESGSVELAIQDLELIRKQQPAPSADLSITLAWLLHSAGRTADAKVEARLANVLAPDNPDVAELLGALAA
jgi:tetratricopeptide (TPR) repeat protein